ncbi:ABC transporter ATP-binding protein [Asticcacaulis tiandongensis]|uniref:ABC transporter ATP-binding protein n=1 Tax=Asticcacaulis tiandongensis TaxID=2565365 RepID=UPI00112C5A0B|nr:ABC transporter ATP-binding protein [Asticcacaulis tiandongensis]
MTGFTGSGSGPASGPAPVVSRPQSQDEAIFESFNPRVLERFGTYLKPYRQELFFTLAAVAAFVAAQVTIPLLIKAVVDHSAGTATDNIPFDVLIAAFAGLIVLNTISNFFQEWSAAQLAQKVVFDLRRAMFSHLQDVSLTILDKTQVGRLMSRLQGDVNALQEFLETSVSALGDLFLLFGIVGVLLWLDWRLGLLTLGVLPVMIGIRAVWLPWAKPLFRRARDTSSIVNGVLAENIGGVRTVQGARREDHNFDYFSERVTDSFNAQTRAALAAQLMVPTVEILTGVALALIVVIGGYAVLGGQIGVGVMVAFIFYVQRFFDPIRTLSIQYTVMQRAMAAAHRIFEVLDVPVDIRDKPDAVRLSDEPPSVEFRSVTFGYQPDHPILKDISFRAEPGQMLALVGPTGSGKTSITALTNRFYDVWEGQVLVGGHDVRDVELPSLGHFVSMVLQEPFLFTGTILENIRYRSGATDEDIFAAAKAVRAHDFITRLPNGYATRLAQRGQNLSLGQRQLLSFARALVANPKILILDEATASIDSFTELDIQEALKVLLKGRTSLVIAHRLATVRDADRILVLKDGRIIEDGDHDALIRQGGLYADLYARNYASFDDLTA